MFAFYKTLHLIFIFGRFADSQDDVPLTLKQRQGVVIKEHSKRRKTSDRGQTTAVDVEKVSGPGGEEEEDVRFKVQVYFKGMKGEAIHGTFGSLDNVDLMRNFLCKRLDGNVKPAQLTLIFSGKHLDGKSTLEELHAGKECTIHFVQRQRGRHRVAQRQG